MKGGTIAKEFCKYSQIVLTKAVNKTSMPLFFFSSYCSISGSYCDIFVLILRTIFKEH